MQLGLTPAAQAERIAKQAEALYATKVEEEKSLAPPKKQIIVIALIDIRFIFCALLIVIFLFPPRLGRTIVPTYSNQADRIGLSFIFTDPAPAEIEKKMALPFGSSGELPYYSEIDYKMYSIEIFTLLAIYAMIRPQKKGSGA